MRDAKDVTVKLEKQKRRWLVRWLECVNGRNYRTVPAAGVGVYYNVGNNDRADRHCAFECRLRALGSLGILYASTFRMARCA